METSRERPWGLVEKGVCYDTGTNFDPDRLSRVVWREDLMRQELQVITDDLHCNAVNVSGTDIDRLVECSAAALESGLHVWFQPVLINGSPRETLDHLSAAAQAAERLRARYSSVTLVLGCELTILMSGIIPGRGFQQRITNLGLTWWWLSSWFNRRLNNLLRKANAVAKSSFGGQTTYAAGFWENVDWNEFDVVGLNYYRYSGNESSYVKDLRSFHRYGKPIVILEFGCCSYQGAEKKGPSGYDIITWSDPPELKGAHVRDEQVQADYVAHLIEIYESENIYGAFAFEFIAPSYPHAPDPRHDLDMASFSLVKVFPDDSGRGYESGHWEPKAAFHEIARRYGGTPRPGPATA